MFIRRSAETGQDGQQKRWRYGPLRLIAPPACIVAGVILIVQYAGSIGAGPYGTTLFVMGCVMIPLGIGALLIARWMAKRGL